jgi:hypothetical protein
MSCRSLQGFVVLHDVYFDGKYIAFFESESKEPNILIKVTLSKTDLHGYENVIPE